MRSCHRNDQGVSVVYSWFWKTFIAFKWIWSYTLHKDSSEHWTYEYVLWMDSFILFFVDHHNCLSCSPLQIFGRIRSSCYHFGIGNICWIYSDFGGIVRRWFFDLLYAKLHSVITSRVFFYEWKKKHKMTSSLFLLYFCLIFFISGYILSTPINKRIDIFFSLIGGALFIATGALILQDWNGGFNSAFKTETHKLAITKAWLAIANGVLFFLDAMFTFCE